MRKRIPFAQRTFELTGSYKGFMMPELAQDLVSFISHAKPLERSKILGGLTSGAGDLYPAVIEQLTDAGLEGSFAGEAAAAAQSDYAAAAILRKGEERQADSKVRELWLPGYLSTDLNADIAGRLSNSLQVSDEYRSLMAQAYRAAYVGLMSSYPDKKSYRIDKEMADRAFQIATGGFVSHKGFTNLPPWRNFDQAKWEKFMISRWDKNMDESFHPSEISRMNNGAKATLWSNETVANWIKNGDAYLIETGIFGANKYFIMKDGQPIQATNGHPLFFTFFEDYKTVRSGHMDEQAQKAVEGTPGEKDAIRDAYSPDILNFMKGGERSGELPIPKFDFTEIVEKGKDLLRNVPQAKFVWDKEDKRRK